MRTVTVETTYDNFGRKVKEVTSEDGEQICGSNWDFTNVPTPSHISLTMESTNLIRP